MKLNEIYSKKMWIVENNDKATLTVGGTFAKADTVSKSGRLFPANILQKAISKVQKQIESGQTPFGVSGNITSVEGLIPNVSHKIESIWFDEQDKVGMANVTILPTTAGKEVSILIRNSGALYFSLRATGTTTKAESHEIVNDDLTIHGVDISLTGGWKESRFTSKNIVGESWALDPKEQKAMLEESKILKRFAYAKNAGYKGNFATYKREVEGTESATDKEMTSFRNAKMSGYKGNLRDYLDMIRD